MKNPSILHRTQNQALHSDQREGSSLVKNTLLVCATVVLAIVAILHPLVGNAVARENGPLEILQFALLASGFLMLASQSVQNRAAAPGLAPFALLYLTLALRELDLRHTAAPEWLVQATFQNRHLWLTPLWLTAIGFAIVRRKEIKQWAAGLEWNILKPLAGLMVGAYALSFAFEKHLLAPKGAVATFWEETAELLLAVCLVAFARALSRHSRDAERVDYGAVRSFN